jgi:chemotaxis protein methyltransferase CheR
MTKQSGYCLEHISFEGRAARGPKHRQNYIARKPSSIEREPLDPYIAWVLGSIGLPPDSYRTAPLHRRLTACLRNLKVGSVFEAWDLMQNRESVSKAIDSLIINVTEFFRDAEVFDELRKVIVAYLANRKDRIRIWSAGCSDGAELYSVAILLAEAGLIDRSILVGTDCRATAIHKARAGLYGEAHLKSVNGSHRSKYLHYAAGNWRVGDLLKRHTQWHVRNLLAGSEEGPWDLILWRNMAIYLNNEPALPVWDALIKELRPGGFLVVGKAEGPPASAGLTNLSRCIYQSQQSLRDATGCMEKREASR